MSYNIYVTKLKNVRPHPNADRLQLADCFGNTVCISLDHSEGELGVYLMSYVIAVRKMMNEKSIVWYLFSYLYIEN